MVKLRKVCWLNYSWRYFYKNIKIYQGYELHCFWVVEAIVEHKAEICQRLSTTRSATNDSRGDKWNSLNDVILCVFVYFQISPRTTVVLVYSK